MLSYNFNDHNLNIKCRLPSELNSLLSKMYYGVRNPYLKFPPISKTDKDGTIINGHIGSYESRLSGKVAQ